MACTCHVSFIFAGIKGENLKISFNFSSFCDNLKENIAADRKNYCGKKI